MNRRRFFRGLLGLASAGALYGMAPAPDPKTAFLAQRFSEGLKELGTKVEWKYQSTPYTWTEREIDL